MERIRILDTDIDNLTRRGVAERLERFLDEEKPRLVVTANPEIVLRAHRVLNYRKLIDGADLIVADGFGLILVSYLMGRPIRQRVTGVDVLHDLFSLAEEKEIAVFVGTNKRGLVRFDEVKHAALRHHPKLIIRGADLSSDEKTGDAQGQIVVCNFGAPDQEFWFSRNQASFPNARVMIGVGGALDYIAGRVRRAPKIIRYFGMEWLWRLALQPWRLPRIFDAVFRFPLAALTHKPHAN